MYDCGDGYAFMCDECGICDGWEHRLSRSLKAPEYGPPQPDHCGCDKIGHYFYAGGYCSDAWMKMQKKKKRPAHKGHAYRRAMTRKADDRRKRMLKEGQRPNFWRKYKLIDGMWQEADYIQPFSYGERKKYAKKASRRAVRRTEELPSGKSGYKKCFDLPWTIY